MNWKSLIQDLRDAGNTYEEIATRAGMSRGAVHDLHKGRCKTVLYETGKALVNMHKRVSKQAKAVSGRPAEEQEEV